MKNVIKIVGSGLVVSVIMLLVGCGVNYTGNPDNDSTTCGNITMGQGKFAYADGFVYFTDFSNIYEYDTESQKTVVLKGKSDDIKSIYVQDDYIYFGCNGLRRLRRDGKRVRQVYESENAGLQTYVNGSDAYILQSIEGSFYHRNLTDGTETKLMDHVMGYYVDDENIYVVAKREDGIPYLFVGGREDMKFEMVELSFSPIAVAAAGDAVYLSARGTYQIIKYSSRGEEPLPVYATYYQAVDDKILYLDAKTFENSCFDLAVYDEISGESRTVFEGVYDFGMVGENCVGIQAGTQPGAGYYLYDMENDETVFMYEPE